MSDKVTRGGMNFPAVLLVVFVVLKLTDCIDWSWWWVLSPLWLPIALGLILGIIGILLGRD